MNMQNYEIFFTLRDKYPKHCQLIAELMSFAFQHNDSFSKTTYLNGNFKEDDVKFIFEKLNLPSIERVVSANLRSNNFTILYLSAEVQINSNN